MPNGVISFGGSPRQKWRAYRVLNNAVNKGVIKRGNCEICGRHNAHGHHRNYSKPLSVRWLCPRHHRETHTHKRCPSGHLMTAANTFISNGRRGCRKCRRANSKKYGAIAKARRLVARQRNVAPVAAHRIVKIGEIWKNRHTGYFQRVEQINRSFVGLCRVYQWGHQWKPRLVNFRGHFVPRVTFRYANAFTNGSLKFVEQS